MSDAPWWYNRCMHNGLAPWTKWCILREAEGVVVLYYSGSDMVHITVDLPGVGSSCKVLVVDQYDKMGEPELMTYLQSQRRELRSLNQM